MSRFLAFIESPLTLAAIATIFTLLALLLPSGFLTVLGLLLSLAFLLGAGYRLGWFNAATALDRIARWLSAAFVLSLALGGIGTGAWWFHTKDSKTPVKAEVSGVNPETPVVKDPVPESARTPTQVIPPQERKHKPKANIAPTQVINPNETISAPNGIAIGGGAKVDNPVVNNFGEPKRFRILSEPQIENAIAVLSTHPAKINVTAMSGDEEAVQLAQQLYSTFSKAGWTMMDTGVGSVMLIGPPTYGVGITYHGEKLGADQKSMETPPDTPLRAIAVGLQSSGLKMVANPSPNIPEDTFQLTVWRIPPVEK